jgi:hypothetical protein
MLRHFTGTKNRAAKVHDIFLKYLKSYRTFVDLAEKRAIKVSPETKRASQVAFRLQRLLNERQTLRFEFLFTSKKLEPLEMQTLSSIETRIDAGWTEAEESDLMLNFSSYKNIAREINDLNAAMDPGALARRRAVLEKDSKYLEARLALAERARKLMNQMTE